MRASRSISAEIPWNVLFNENKARPRLYRCDLGPDSSPGGHLALFRRAGEPFDLLLILFLIVGLAELISKGCETFVSGSQIRKIRECFHEMPVRLIGVL